MKMGTDNAVEVFYDGDCPLCMREINMLRRMDKKKRIQFTDIAASGFDPSLFAMTQDDFMKKIQGRLPDGSFIEGVEVFRRLYGAVGLGWLLAPTKLPGLRQASDWAYEVFAKNRLRWTGRSCSTETCKT